jgi:hypothetical protein
MAFGGCRAGLFYWFPLSRYQESGADGGAQQKWLLWLGVYLGDRMFIKIVILKT